MNGLRVIHTGKLAGHDVSQPDLTELRQIHMRQTAAQDTSQPHMTSTTYDRIMPNPYSTNCQARHPLNHIRPDY